MKRKRYIKLLMGNLSYSRNEANAACEFAKLKGSYEDAYKFLEQAYISSLKQAITNVCKRISEYATRAARALTKGLNAFAETYRKEMKYAVIE